MITTPSKVRIVKEITDWSHTTGEVKYLDENGDVWKKVDYAPSPETLGTLERVGYKEGDYIKY